MATIWKVQDEAGVDSATLDDSGNLAITGLLQPTLGKLVTCTLSAAAEAADAIVVTLNTVDLAGTAVSRAQHYHLELFQPTMIAALAAAYTMAESGAGSMISTTANAGLIILTDASGDAAITVTDVAGGSDQTVILKATPIGVSGTYTFGLPTYLILTFDAS